MASYCMGDIMKNKGFSLIELIVVIAIMAILVGALAPALIKYINKSRLSMDIDVGRKLATAISAAVTDEEFHDDAVEHSSPYAVNDMDGNDFKGEVFSTFGVTSLQGKSKKDAQGDLLPSQSFYYTLDADRNKVEIFYGGVTADYQIYPVLGSELSY